MLMDKFIKQQYIYKKIRTILLYFVFFNFIQQHSTILFHFRVFNVIAPFSEAFFLIFWIAPKNFCGSVRK